MHERSLMPPCPTLTSYVVITVEEKRCHTYLVEYITSFLLKHFFPFVIISAMQTTAVSVHFIHSVLVLMLSKNGTSCIT